MVGPAAKIVHLVVMGLVRQPVGVMLVRGKTGPAARSDGEEFRHEQAADSPGRVLAKNVLDLAVGFRLVRAVLNLVDVGWPYDKGTVGLVETGAGDEDFGVV